MNEQVDMNSLLSGELTAEAIDALLDRAESDPVASRELDIACDLLAAIEAERPALQAPNGSAGSDLSPPHLRTVRQAVGIASLAAASILVWLGIRSPDSAPAPRDPLVVASVEFVPPAYLPLELRATDTDLASRFRSAMEAYTLRDWSKAEEELTGFIQRNPGHGPALFYRAAVHEALRQEDAAALGYRASADLAAGPVSEHALWRLAELELRRGRRAVARSVLDELVALNGSFAANAEALRSNLVD